MDSDITLNFVKQTSKPLCPTNEWSDVLGRYQPESIISPAQVVRPRNYCGHAAELYRIKLEHTIAIIAMCKGTNVVSGKLWIPVVRGGIS
jgi:hypothetical protein